MFSSGLRAQMAETKNLMEQRDRAITIVKRAALFPCIANIDDALDCAPDDLCELCRLRLDAQRLLKQDGWTEDKYA